jgi:hypothetical protein
MSSTEKPEKALDRDHRTLPSARLSAPRGYRPRLPRRKHLAEDDAPDLHGDVDLADAVLRTLARVRPEGLHPERERSDRRTVADRTVHDDPGPAVLDGGCRDQVADEGRLERAAAVDDEDGALAGRRERRLDESVVAVAANGADRAVEGDVPADVVQLQGERRARRPVRRTDRPSRWWSWIPRYAGGARAAEARRGEIRGFFRARGFRGTHPLCIPLHASGSPDAPAEHHSRTGPTTSLRIPTPQETP